jgi:2-methylisocitrate lyase-like PEP mutase family enzyme
MPTPAEKRARFRELHQDGCFVIPNPWDAGSARMLQAMGFRALASTSSGFAWSTGRLDNEVPLDDMLAHLAVLAAATDLPLNADFENGYADAPEEVAANVRRALASGVAGLSIEDMSHDPGKPLYGTALAVERVRSARAEIEADDRSRAGGARGGAADRADGPWADAGPADRPRRGRRGLPLCPGPEDP